jgi:hypothetical protein
VYPKIESVKKRSLFVVADPIIILTAHSSTSATATMSPNTSPAPYRDRADYMATYREENGSGRDHTLIDCFCGKEVEKYNLIRHLRGKNHPPAPDLDLVRRAQEKKEAAERERKFDATREQWDAVITQLNRRLFIDVGDSASLSDLVGKGLSLFNDNLKRYDRVHPEWKAWAHDFVIGLSSYYNIGRGMTLYQGHLRSMDKDHTYRRKVERARRRVRAPMRRPRTPVSDVPANHKRIKLPVELRRFLGEVDSSE